MVSFLALILWIAIGIVVSKILGFYTKSTINRYGGSFLATVLLFGFAAGTHSYYIEHKKEQEAYLAGFRSLEDYEVAKSKGIETKSAFDAYEAEKKRKEKEAKLEEKARDEGICKKDPACWGERNWLPATFACDELIEKASSFAFEWTDGVMGVKFAKYKMKNNEVVTYVGDKIKLKNIFGAWQNHIYECDYDTANKAVLDVRLRPGHLP